MARQAHLALDPQHGLHQVEQQANSKYAHLDWMCKAQLAEGIRCERWRWWRRRPLRCRVGGLHLQIAAIVGHSGTSSNKM